MYEIKQIKYLVSQTLLVIKDIEKSTEVSPIIEYSSKIREFSKLPPKVQVTLPTFSPKPIEHEKLYVLLGQITPLSTVLEETVLIPKERKTSFRLLLDEPELVTAIKTGHKKPLNVTCLNDDQIWISAMTNDIESFNMRGLLLQTILTKSGDFPLDIDVDSDEDLLYLDWKTRTVCKVKNGQTEELIRLQGWVPINLCVSSTGDLLITMYSDDTSQSKAVRYSESTEQQT